MRIIERVRELAEAIKHPSHDQKKVRRALAVEASLGPMVPFAHFAMTKVFEKQFANLDVSERWWLAAGILAASTLSHLAMNYTMLKHHDVCNDSVTNALHHAIFKKEKPNKAVALRFIQAWTIDLVKNPTNFALIINTIQQHLSLPPEVTKEVAKIPLPNDPPSMVAALGIVVTSFAALGNSYLHYHETHADTAPAELTFPEISDSSEDLELAVAALFTPLEPSPAFAPVFDSNHFPPNIE